ncbi:GvpL/GvpF family gas vesicle protein [Streptomyces lonarensis]|uniref:GvpL/GvpF family gas vesicle protein n=1 Tax=Streptomyces lonarensis TaxID=700599 RepID=A0A7X6D1A5_9ACTN|nr:GvpL/GvpF family gas vesicle protein [Streptomyces lonarensis]NJQ06235.1 GvpL/GvpF family gas vesicle protein [Streptomyces lonarensis]
MNTVPCYLYAITAADHPAQTDSLVGVGDPPAELRVVQAGEVKAYISDVPEDLKARRRHLLAHQEVLNALLGEGPVLPMQFGHIAPDEAQIREVLGERSADFLEQLQRVGDCVEFHVKATRAEADVIREVTQGSDEIQQLRQRAQRPGASHEDQVALGEAVSRAIASQRASDGADLHERLAPAAGDSRAADPAPEESLAASYLVPVSGAEEFGRLVTTEQNRLGDGWEVRLFGPLPPYSFV